MGIDDLRPTSYGEDFSVNTKGVPQRSLTNLITASQRSRKNLEAKYCTVRTDDGIVFEDKICDHPNEDVLESFPTTSAKVQGFSHPSFPSPDAPLKPSFPSLENCGLTEVLFQHFVCLS
ncbi:ankyrin repeat domain-containing protein 26-like [Lemur catta]|uniref:ankyrin repeat domain-containing protein 26-like n=1 Tax=Lemur catta TaxID=9447 RepID=UPI001E26D4D2|nr:ankyrin repeat domain-containing protein 26-like [Lemur catta]